MSKFAKSIRTKLERQAIPAPTIIPLKELDTWYPACILGKLNRDAQLQLYWNVAIHAHVVNSLCEMISDENGINPAVYHQDNLVQRLQDLYKEAQASMRESIERQGAEKVRPS